MQVSEIVLDGNGEATVQITGNFLKVEKVPSGNTLLFRTTGATPTPIQGSKPGNTPNTLNENESFLGTEGRSTRFDGQFQRLEITGGAPNEEIIIQTGFGWMLDGAPKTNPPGSAPLPFGVVGSAFILPGGTKIISGPDFGFPQMPSFSDIYIEVGGGTGNVTVFGSLLGGGFSAGQGQRMTFYDLDGSTPVTQLVSGHQYRANMSGYTELFFENIDVTNNAQVSFCLTPNGREKS